MKKENKNIIKINEDFEMYRDNHQWILWHWTDGVDKHENGGRYQYFK